jgi:hypothetical protein
VGESRYGALGVGVLECLLLRILFVLLVSHGFGRYLVEMLLEVGMLMHDCSFDY